jgi:glucose-6-phosphate-specific signal transduction histidine kinase
VDRTREALANVQKHAAPCRVSVRVESDDRRVEVGVADDGCGGADAHGAGLRGLADRIEILGWLLRRCQPRGRRDPVGAEIPLG